MLDETMEPVGPLKYRDNMELRRITAAEAGERDADESLAGPISEPLRSGPALFRRVCVDGGTVTWPNGADLYPDVVIWGGRPPATKKRPAPLFWNQEYVSRGIPKPSA